MYATVTWSIDSGSTSSAEIKRRLEKSFGTLTNTALMANVRILKLRKVADLGILGRRLEAIHTDFPTEFKFVCVGSEGGQPLAPEGRAEWDMALVEQIIAVDD